MKRLVRNITKRVLYFSQAVDIAIHDSFRFIPTVCWSNAGARNYFRPQAKIVLRVKFMSNMLIQS